MRRNSNNSIFRFLFVTILIIGIGGFLLSGAGIVSSCTAKADKQVAIFWVKNKETAYSSSEDGDRFYRITSRNGQLFEIRDNIFTGVWKAGGIYARFTRGCKAKVEFIPENGWWRKYPQITNFIGQTCPK